VLYFATHVITLKQCVALLVKNGRNSISTLYCCHLGSRDVISHVTIRSGWFTDNQPSVSHRHWYIMR